jgi:hypothetical protein
MAHGACATCQSGREGERCRDCGNVEACCGPCGCRVWKLVPAGTRDEYAAGYDGNHFASREEAEDAIEGLRAVGPEFDCDWEAIEVCLCLGAPGQHAVNQTGG